MRGYLGSAALAGLLTAGLAGLTVDTSADRIWIGFHPLDLCLGGALGVLYGLLACTCLRLAGDLHRERVLPSGFLGDVTDAMRCGDYRLAVFLAQTNRSPLARVLVVGLARLPHGLEPARDASWRRVQVFLAEQERRLAYLEMLGTLGPALGLLTGLHVLGLF